MFTAQLPDKGTFVIRYPRGKGSLTDWRCPLEEIPVGKGRCLKDGNDVALLTLGPIGKLMEAVVESAAKEGVSVAHYDIRFVKPLDEEMLHAVGKKFKNIVTVEDGVISGGAGSAIIEFMAANGYSPTIRCIGIPDTFVEHGTTEQLYEICGMDKDTVLRTILQMKKQ